MIGWRLWHMLLKWAIKKHSTSGKLRLVLQYFKKVDFKKVHFKKVDFKKVEARTRVFYGKDDKELHYSISEGPPIVPHIMVQHKNPFKKEELNILTNVGLKESFIAWHNAA